ncbi:hypothetical protein AYL99_11638 [Fonsecaea erecta]|uniref:Uncharacterized protein n=1 Tax=Fonsecaea erecta TaxID=1367422 RepID=A0A178Z4I4_9EURO|nr:hypothetical protein AYL99_11638 [Fonsecaea erecta]OAP54103.1 hypothetical protein AYL99_11638 [Fonsecaea erecta]
MSAAGPSCPDGPFAGPPLSPASDFQNVDQALQELEELKITDESRPKRVSSEQFHRLIETRIIQAAADPPPALESTPQLAESPAPEAPSNGRRKDVFLGESSTSVELGSKASLRERVYAQADYGSTLAPMLDPLLGDVAMSIVRSYLNTQRLEMQGELCEVMVRDIMTEIVAYESSVAADHGVFADGLTTEGKTVRAAMEILVEKGDLVDDVNRTHFRGLMRELHLFCAARGIEYRSR